MKKILFIITYFLFAHQAIFAEPFRVGEEYKYKIRWGVMPVGYSTMSIPKKMNYKGKECILLQTEATGNDFVNAIFPVKDKIISIWDPKEKRTYYNEKDLNEGFFHRHHIVEFDYAKKIATWSQSSISGNSDKVGIERKDAKWKYKSGVTPKLPNDFQDILSAIYYNRSYKAIPKAGSSFTMNLFDDLKITKMKMEILKRDTITLEVDGKETKFKTWHTKPYISTSGMFVSTGDINIWITDDEKRIPVKVTSKIPYLGNVTVELMNTNP